MKKSSLYKIVVLSTMVFVMSLLPVFSQILSENTIKLGSTLNLIDAYYVDTVNQGKLTEKAITEMLRSLDPHSTYISAKDVKEMNEPLNGNFEGIGVQFNLLHDSIIIVEPISGGPSEKVGVKAGDRIITIDKEKVTGIGLTTEGVRKRLMGAKGTHVNITVFRKGEKDLLEYTIIRDKIPIYSLDASYMIDKETGYIKLNKFAATTEKEFSDAVAILKKNNMKNLILDLRGNGGGYMLAATAIADKFFTDKKLLVFIKGRKTPRQDYSSGGNGILASARLVVLTDEESASASEILTGAIQDWDRGVVIGRRTFGKGLVQNGFYLTDGSMIRLTIARYYTPTGRLIQSPYEDGYEKYMENFYKRYTDGEMLTADSTHFPDSVKYKTMINKRIVYGGGGIMPDIFVPADTSYNTPYLRKLVGKNVLNTYALEYCDKNRDKLSSMYKSFSDFKSGFSFSPEDIKDVITRGEADDVKYDDAQFNISREEILLFLKGLVASNIWTTSDYFQILNENDNVIENAMKVLTDNKIYNKLLGNK
jgi:carboxyl-terminal processing protease